MTDLHLILALPLALRAGTGKFARPIRRRPFDRSLIATTIVLITSETVLTLAASVLLAGVWSAVMFAP